MTDTASEPLITSNDTGADEREYEQGKSVDEELEEVDVNESALVSPGIFIWTLTLCAGISGLLFGYEYVPTFLRLNYIFVLHLLLVILLCIARCARIAR